MTQKTPLKWRYHYSATVLRVVDGDTVDVRLDLGLDTYRNERLRLYGIDAPESHTATRVEGDAATAHLVGLLLREGAIVVRTHKDQTDKYGRYMATIYAEDGTNINQQMVADGHAVDLIP